MTDQTREAVERAFDLAEAIVAQGRLPSGRMRSKYLTIPAELFYKAVSIKAERDTALARIAGMDEPVAWVSPMQFAEVQDPDITLDSLGGAAGGKCIPFRKTKAGLFTQPLYATPAAALARAEDILRPEHWNWKLNRHPLVPVLREAVADGFTNGNEPYDDATEAQQHRYDLAVYAVIKKLLSLSPAPTVKGEGE